jgi:tripartite-type tricarboxylate transporter receptor subunit TctC
MIESGFPDLVVGSWQGVFVPKATPRPVVDQLFPAVVKTMHEPDVVRQLGTASAAAITSKSPEDFRRFWEGEDQRWSKVVAHIGAAAQ